MIVSFLCLIGPGAFSCLVQRKFSGKDGVGQSVILTLLEVIAYSIVNMAVTVTILQPLGEAEVMVLPDGMPSVRYGSEAMLLSMILAAVIGLCGKRICMPKDIYGKGRKRKYIRYILAAAIVVFLLKHPMDVQMPDMRISSVPIKINDVFYGGEDPVYISGESGYFISCRALAQGLDLDYGMKSSDLFLTEYYLGNNIFTVNRMTPGRDFYLKDQELYISLDYLGQEESFSDIHVSNEPVLSDGTDRKIIYIDNYPKRFDTDWIEKVSSGRGDMVVHGTAYISFAESFAQDYARGCRMFAADLRTMTGSCMKKSICLLKEYPDAWFIIDVSSMQETDVADQLRLFVKTAENVESEVLARTILQVYSERMFYVATDIFDWSCVIYYIKNFVHFSEKDFITFAYREGIKVVAGNIDATHELFVRELLERDIKIFQYKKWAVQ